MNDKQADADGVGVLGVGTTGVGVLGVGGTTGVGVDGVGVLGVGTTGVGVLGVGGTTGVGVLGVGTDGVGGTTGVGVDGVGTLGVGTLGVGGTTGVGVDGVGTLGVGVLGVGTDGVGDGFQIQSLFTPQLPPEPIGYVPLGYDVVVFVETINHCGTVEEQTPYTTPSTPPSNDGTPNNAVNGVFTSVPLKYLNPLSAVDCVFGTNTNSQFTGTTGVGVLGVGVLGVGGTTGVGVDGVGTGHDCLSSTTPNSLMTAVSVLVPADVVLIG